MSTEVLCAATCKLGNSSSYSVWPSESPFRAADQKHFSFRRKAIQSAYTNLRLQYWKFFFLFAELNDGEKDAKKMYPLLQCQSFSGSVGKHLTGIQHRFLPSLNFATNVVLRLRPWTLQHLNQMLAPGLLFFVCRFAFIIICGIFATLMLKLQAVSDYKLSSYELGLFTAINPWLCAITITNLNCRKPARSEPR